VGGCSCRWVVQSEVIDDDNDENEDGKTTMVWLPDGEKYEDMFIHFDRIQERDRHPERQKDRQTLHDGIGRAYAKHCGAKSHPISMKFGTGTQQHISVRICHLVRNDTDEKGMCKSLLVFHCNYAVCLYLIPLFKYLASNNGVTLKSWLGVVRGH